MNGYAKLIGLAALSIGIVFGTAVLPTPAAGQFWDDEAGLKSSRNACWNRGGTWNDLLGCDTSKKRKPQAKAPPPAPKPKIKPVPKPQAKVKCPPGQKVNPLFAYPRSDLWGYIGPAPTKCQSIFVGTGIDPEACRSVLEEHYWDCKVQHGRPKERYANCAWSGMCGAHYYQKCNRWSQAQFKTCVSGLIAAPPPPP